MSEWKEYKLGDCVEMQKGFAFKSSDYINKGIKIIKVSNLNQNRFDDSSCVFISPISAELYSRYSLFEDDIIISTVGSWPTNPESVVGKVCRVSKIINGSLLNQNAVRLRVKNNFNQRFLYYVLSGSNFSSFIANTAQGSANQASITLEDIRSFKFFSPSKKDQDKIVSILSSLDDKIANNRRICENLEAQAQALFKHWFIDFAPFKDGKFVESELGMIPEGWRVGCLSDVLDLIKETTNQGERPELPYLPIDSIPMKSFLLNEVKDNSEAQSSLLLFKKNDILVGAMRVYFHRVIPAPFDGITRSTCFVLRPKCDDYFSFALCVTNSNDAIRYAQKTSKGSTMPYAVWNGGLGSYCILIPPKSILKDFNLLIKNNIGLIQNMYFENHCLTTLRDTLLPKLMSGEIDVTTNL